MSGWRRRIAVTGGCGFIGGAYLRQMVPRHPEDLYVNIDALTYAASPERVAAVAHEGNYVFERVDIRDTKAVVECLGRHSITDVVHFAAESHNDRAILTPLRFVETNVVGTANLLESWRVVAKGSGGRFHHISTDEVYGSLPIEGGEGFTESTPYDPSSPYSASKAAADHLVRAWHRTFGLDVVITNCSNNFGPFQFPEKLLPVMISNALSGRRLPVYGDGMNVRDWIHVEDHCDALDLVLRQGRAGRTYNIGADCEIPNITLVTMLCEIIDQREGPLPGGRSRASLIEFVPDRPGHDRRYAIDASRIREELGWSPRHEFRQALEDTVDWYRTHRAWVENCQKSDEFRAYAERNYGERSGDVS
ncbi:MAG TPA: dTDP-glucose 4,6-dehydratase [Armatimonadota bacterium]|nr:dTDP-glucose 4,6-dehydratase [Armatimonadota bacterium]